MDARLGIKLFELAGHMTRECRKHGRHVELTFAREYLFLEFGLILKPRHGQWRLPVVDVRHAVPGQLGGAGEVVAYLLVCQAHLAPYLIPYRLLACDRKRHGHAVESHPVDHALPVRPFPVRHRVAVGAVIEEEAVVDVGCRLDASCYGGKHVGHDYRVGRKPRDAGSAIVLEVMIETDGERVVIVACNDDLSVARIDQCRSSRVLLQTQMNLHAAETAVRPYGLPGRHPYATAYKLSLPKAI